MAKSDHEFMLDVVKGALRVPPQPERIVVKVVGGVVFAVEGVPQGVEVEIHDYDMPSWPTEAELAECQHDENGDAYYCMTWE